MWTAHAQRVGIKVDFLSLDLATLAQVNLITWENVFLNNKYHNVDIYSEKCHVIQCFKWQKY